MTNKLKLLTIILLSMLFSFTMMSVFYFASYMAIQNNPTTLFHVIEISKEDKTIILVSLNIVYTIVLSLYSFTNMYLSFYKGDSNHVH